MKIKKCLFLIVIISFSTSLFAQTQFTATYSRYHKGFGINDTQTLSFKDSLSVFNFYQKKEKKEVSFYEVELSFEKYTSLYNVKNNLILEQNKLKDGTLLVASWKHTLNWKLSEETKVINGYTVQKATVQSYNYPVDRSENFGIATAWFTTEIPVSIGPFRYNGLPGLILELSFEKYGATYKMTKIDFDTAVTIPKIDKGIKVTKEQSIHPEEINKKWLKKQKSTSKENNKSWWQVWN